MDRGGHIERSFPLQHEPGHDRELAGEHRGEDEQAPQESAQNFQTRGARWIGIAVTGGNSGLRESIRHFSVGSSVLVLPGLVPSIHVFLPLGQESVDGRTLSAKTRFARP